MLYLVSITCLNAPSSWLLYISLYLRTYVNRPLPNLFLVLKCGIYITCSTLEVVQYLAAKLSGKCWSICSRIPNFATENCLSFLGHLMVCKLTFWHFLCLRAFALKTVLSLQVCKFEERLMFKICAVCPFTFFVTSELLALS